VTLVFRVASIYPRCNCLPVTHSTWTVKSL